jgi:hypothetical protein
VFAFFIFAVALLLVAASSDYALKSGQRSNRESRAALLAQSRLAEIREWCQRTPPNQFANYLGYPNLGSWLADDFGYESRLDLVAHHTYSPSLASEIFLPADQRRPFDASLLRVRVQVRWGGLANQSYQLVSLISDSRRGWRAATPIEVTQISGALPLGQGLSADFQAVGYDDQGQPIPDLTFRWLVVPGTSCGLLDYQSPDGKKATFTHHMPKVPGPGFDFASSGEVWVMASARYWGVEQTGRMLVQLL